MKGKKHYLTPEQRQWLIDHFADTKNEDIIAHLDISLSTMHRFKKELGLAKSAEFMRAAQRHANMCAVVMTKGVPPHPNSLKALLEHGPNYVFRKGEPLVTRIGEEKNRERLKKAHTKRNETIRKERLRLHWGLPQLTKLRLNEHQKGKTIVRYVLRQRGYHVARAASEAFYDANTQRGKRLERWAARENIKILPL